jgi:hypothetical protein
VAKVQAKPPSRKEKRQNNLKNLAFFASLSEKSSKDRVTNLSINRLDSAKSGCLPEMKQSVKLAMQLQYT